MPFLLVIVAALWWFDIWPFDGTLIGSYTYKPEIGYYAGDEKKWLVGDGFSKREDCVSSAVAIYNSYNAQSRGRAFSWACQKIDRSGAFLERVR